MTVPLWAALLSIIVALVPPFQHALDEHIRPVKGALTGAGNCSIPVTLVVLGAYFYPAKEEGEGVPTSMVESSSSSSSVIAQMKKVLRGARRADEVETCDGEGGDGDGCDCGAFEDDFDAAVVDAACGRPSLIGRGPVFVVSNVLLVASPPALTLAQMTQAASGDAFERLISRTIFWSYCIVTPPTTILYVVIGLMLSRL
ncbi:hypothetical protein V5O48_007789 [Marasmius crinis-equi]|uniref:Uncharacterized protein n=1 Tax=Marasmius crinis-equi TaxID=585013 RepID=A0ABR3FFU7_9AGAR